MNEPTLTDAADMAELLSQHEVDLSALQRDPEVEVGYWMACACGFRWTPSSAGAEHREHVAGIVAARVAEAVDRERAAWATKIEALADEWLDVGVVEEGSYPETVAEAEDACARNLRGLLAADDTEGGKP